MQQTIHKSSSPAGPNQNGPRSQSIIITAITLFALSGLLVGFAFGALTKQRSQPTTNISQNKPSTPITVPRSTTPTPSPTEQITSLGIPHIVPVNTVALVADGATPYTLSAYPIDKAGNQIHSATITCKIWLTKDTDINGTLSTANDQLKNVDTLNQPFPKEEQGALNFTGSQQTQKCSASGNTTWTYTIAPTVDPGSYRLIVLTDWAGQHWNWSYTQFLQITK
ncbi:MAG TPA: hypothetical protein VGN34_00145 [Ktedonobacteraceae bacterium]|jgi:hypothetical protein